MTALRAERARCTCSFWCAVAIAVTLVAWLEWGRGEAAEVRNQLALAKCRVIVETLYPKSGMYPWCGTLVAEHERVADLKGQPDFAATWWYSLVYSAANFSCRVGATAPGLCSGPMDVKSTSRAMHRRMTCDTAANIHHHVAEFWLGYSKGYRGRGLCEYTMLPSAPRDWGGGRFRRTDAKHRAAIRKAYKEGRL